VWFVCTLLRRGYIKALLFIHSLNDRRLQIKGARVEEEYLALFELAGKNGYGFLVLKYVYYLSIFY
jgi:hypothetical protein